MAGEYYDYLGLEIYCYRSTDAWRVEVSEPGQRNRCTLAAFDAQTRRYGLAKARRYIKSRQSTDRASVYFLQTLKPTRT